LLLSLLPPFYNLWDGLFYTYFLKKNQILGRSFREAAPAGRPSVTITQVADKKNSCLCPKSSLLRCVASSCLGLIWIAVFLSRSLACLSVSIGANVRLLLPRLCVHVPPQRKHRKSTGFAPRILVYILSSRHKEDIRKFRVTIVHYPKRSILLSMC
jgi:hypothetical protein